MALKTLNPNATVERKVAALQMTITASKSLGDLMKTNLGPKGTLKMLVGGGGDIKLTKDGNVLLHEMHIQHPTAALIARAATAQDDVTGDGTTSVVVVVGELMRQAERYLAEGVHPRLLTEGIDLGRTRALEFLDKFKQAATGAELAKDREQLICVSRSSLRTKLHSALADKLAEIVVDAVLTIRRPEQALDLYMVEIMTMQHKNDMDTQLVRGLVLDHGGRQPEMPKRVERAFILTCNVSLEYEKTEVNSELKYRTPEERQKMLDAERKWTDDRVRQIIALKKQVCDGTDKGFVVINQKGIDPLSLDMLAKEGILALRRAKRRNMERLTLACGGVAINALDDLSAEVLGYAGLVYEHTLGEDKYTFIEGVDNPFSCTVLIKGPNVHTIAQIKDAVRDGLRAVKNALEDGNLVAGGGAFELACAEHLQAYKNEVSGRAKLGVDVYAHALLAIPKILLENSGFDAMERLMPLQDATRAGHVVGVDVVSGEPMDPVAAGVWDNYRVKRQIIQASAVLTSQLLLVDEVLRAGKERAQDPMQQMG